MRNDTLLKQYWSAFLFATEYELLGKFGESAPFSTQLFAHTNTGLQELQQFMPSWTIEDDPVELTACGPHAQDLCKLFPGRVEDRLRGCKFNGDGYLDCADTTSEAPG